MSGPGGEPPFEAPPGLEALPGRIPVFPLAGVLLLPRANLPLNIFEPRYLAMTRDALAGHKMIGMIQPQEAEMQGKPPALYAIGCLGRITASGDTPDGRILIELEGITRFRIKREFTATTLYRQVEADYGDFARDVSPSSSAGFDRAPLLEALRAFLERNRMQADWNAISSVDDETLVNSLSMLSPFGPVEKQALLEAGSLAERAKLLVDMVSMVLRQTAPDSSAGRLN